MPLLLRRCRIYDAPEDAAPVDLLLRDGRIAEIGAPQPPSADCRVLDAAGRTLIPGLIDLHIHGAGGADVIDADPDALRTMSSTLARLGTTAFLGTAVPRPSERNRHLGVAAELVGRPLGGARLLGLYLEGPFANPKKRGGIPAEALTAPSLAMLEEILELTAGTLRMMTLAPELPGNLELIERLTDAGVIPAFGHSMATYEQTRAGIEAGIRHVTHLFNAMQGLHHRDPGPLPALSDAEELPLELIGDGVHVDPHVVRFARRAFGPGRCILITDGMRTVGLPEGRYVYGDREFESRGGTARYLDGTLIGTSVSLLEVVLRYREYTGCGFAEAVDAASRLPARRLGLNAGAIEVGRDADLVLLDADHSVRTTLVGGEPVYEKP